MKQTILFRIAMAAVCLAVSTVPVMAQEVIYNAIPDPLPTNVVSLGYQATSTSEFGDHIQFAPGPRSLLNVTVTLSNWAKFSDHPTYGAAGFSVPMTFNLYAVDNSGANPAVGGLIGSQTTDQMIAWRPEATVACGTGFGSGGADCFNGLAQNVVFDFTGTIVPEEVIYGLAFNTQSYGETPIGVPGPYNSLNFGLNTGGPSIGVNEDNDALFWDSTYLGRTAGFSRDTDWAPYTGAVAFTAVPEPASFLVFAAGLGMLAASRRRLR